MQTVGITTHLRDAWDDAAEDAIIDAAEQARIAALIAQADDAVRLGLTILKVGDGGHDTRRRLRTHERLYGPIDLDAERRTRRPVDLARVRNAKKHRREATPDDAA